jgi:hypothetical protein
MLQDVLSREKMQAFVAQERGALRDALLKYLAAAGEAQGATPRVNAPLVKYGVMLGRIGCVWVAERAVAGFEIEFGNREDVLKALLKLAELAPQDAVLVVSSRSQFSLPPAEIKTYLQKSPLFRQQQFTVFDYETGTAETVAPAVQPAAAKPVQATTQAPAPQQHERRKIIYGRKGEHKEQD